MDTLFRLVSLHSSDQQHQQQSSYNSSRTNSSSSRSTTEQQHYYNHHYYSYNNNYYTYNNPSPNSFTHPPLYYQEHETFQEECGTNNHLYMDEDFSSSSSSKHFHQHGGGGGGGATQHHNPQSSNTNTNTTPSATATATPIFEPVIAAADFSSFPQDLNLDFSSPSSSSATTSSGAGGGRWASQLLLECARAIAVRDSQRAQQLMWMLNELSSAYGDTDQKVAAYFLQGLFARLTSSGTRMLRTLSSASDRNCSFESTRRTALRFQELSPWSSFGHVAANGAILESFLESSSSASQQRLHILDLSNTFCTQWPTLLEALATRSSDDTPHLSITTVVSSASTSSSVQKVMKEIGQRMEKFARLMGVPFKFNVIHHTGDLSDLDLDSLDLRDSTALAVNCVNALRGVAPVGHRRDAFIASLRRLNPRIVTVVEEEADLEAGDGSGDEDGDLFLKRFRESLRFFTSYLESLEESFPRTSNERLSLERSTGRAVVDLIACPASESAERRETAAGWSRRMRESGFFTAPFSEDVADDVRALLRRYRDGWSMRISTEDAEDSGSPTGVFLAWKDQAMVWASAWRP